MSTTHESPPFRVLLQRLRAAAGLSQEELAKQAGLSRRGVSDLERGERRAPHPATVRRLADALRLDAAERAMLLAAGRGASASAAPPAQPEPATVRRTATAPIALVGRTAECRRIDQLLADARIGSSGVLVLEGEAGIGKSALLRYASEQANGMAVLAARGVESEADIPFASLLELLRPALRSLEQVPDPQAHALRGALALGPAVPSDRFVIGAATLSLLTAHAEQAPLLVLVDDAQWLDHSSADALVFAIRRLVADPIAVLLAERSGEPSPFSAAGLPAFAVGGLDREAAHVVLHDKASGAVPSATAEWLYRATAGNPLALVELAREAPSLRPDLLDRPLPVGARLEQAFIRQVRHLTAEARRAALIAAACDSGDTATILTAASALGVSGRDLEEAESVGLLGIHDGSVEFRHPLIRSVAYQTATPAERRAAHAAVANALSPRATATGERGTWRQPRSGHPRRWRQSSRTPRGGRGSAAPTPRPPWPSSEPPG